MCGYARWPMFFGHLARTAPEDDHHRAITAALRGATENAELDIARPSKLWGLTSWDWTTRHQIKY